MGEWASAMKEPEGPQSIEQINARRQKINELVKANDEEGRVERRGDVHRGVEKAASDLLESHPDLSVDDKLAVAKIMAEFGKEAAVADQKLKDEWWQDSSDDDGRSSLTDQIGHRLALEIAAESAQEKIDKLSSKLSEKRGY